MSALLLAVALAAAPAPAFPVVRVHPGPGVSPAVARELAEEAPVVLHRVGRRLALPVPAPVDLHVLAGLPIDEKRRRALGLAGAPDWASGIAVPSRREIWLFLDRLGIYPHRELPGLLAHEGSHLVLGAAVPPGTRIPHWYDEGLAMVVERDLSLWDQMELARLALFSKPIPLAELRDRWPRAARRARAAYAQSFSMVSYAEDHAPPGAAARLVARLRAGQPFDAAFALAYGITPAELERRWREHVFSRWLRYAVMMAGALVNGLMAGLAILAFLLVRRRRRRRLAEWEDDEEEIARAPIVRVPPRHGRRAEDE